MNKYAPITHKEHFVHIILSLIFFPWIMVWMFRIHQTQENNNSNP